MSLYPGPMVSQEYAHGHDEGFADGEQDRADSVPASAITNAALMDSQNAHTRHERAWWLGYLRGYREAVRTLQEGKWGT